MKFMYITNKSLYWKKEKSIKQNIDRIRIASIYINYLLSSSTISTEASEFAPSNRPSVGFWRRALKISLPSATRSSAVDKRIIADNCPAWKVMVLLSDV